MCSYIHEQIQYADDQRKQVAEMVKQRENQFQKPKTKSDVQYSQFNEPFPQR